MGVRSSYRYCVDHMWVFLHFFFIFISRFNDYFVSNFDLFFLFCLIVLLAISVPELGLFISLFGALCLSVLGISFPSLMEICVLYPDKWGRFNHVVIRNVLLIAIGLFALITGTNKSLTDIVKKFTANSNELSKVDEIFRNFTSSTQPNTL